MSVQDEHQSVTSPISRSDTIPDCTHDHNCSDTDQSSLNASDIIVATRSPYASVETETSLQSANFVNLKRKLSLRTQNRKKKKPTEKVETIEDENERFSPEEDKHQAITGNFKHSLFYKADDDFHFLMSILPFMRTFDSCTKISTRIEMMKIISKEVKKLRTRKIISEDSNS